MSNKNNKKFIKSSIDRSNLNIQDRNKGDLTNWKTQTEVKQLNLYIYIFKQKQKQNKKAKMNASSINLFFHDIDLSTTTGIKTFNNTIIGLDDEEKYDVIQDSITKHLRAGKDQGENYGWSNNVVLIDTTPGFHLSVYEYPVLITKQMIETASQAIWTIVNDANIQHYIRANMMYLFHCTSITEKSWNAIKKHKKHW